MEGLLSWIARIGDALPAERYTALFEQAGFSIIRVEDHSDALIEMVRQVQTRLLGAEIAVGLKKLDLPGIDFTTAKQFAQAAFEATRKGTLGYAVIVATK